MGAGIAGRTSRVAHAGSLPIEDPVVFQSPAAATVPEKLVHAVRAFVESWPARTRRQRIGVSSMSGSWLLQYNVDADKRGDPF
jgi:hypothetical protein